MENANINESAQSTKCPAVSVIVPAYNTEKYIAECLDSILAQTFKDFEVICVDDGSTDKTLSIFEEYAKRDSRIKLIHLNDLGIVASRNNAIAVARGEYIFPLDGDDMIALDCLEVLYNFITTHDYAVVGPSARYFGELEKGKIYCDPLMPTKWSMYRLANGLYNSAMYPKRLWEKYGGYDHLFDKGLEDYDFWLNFLDDEQKIIRLPNRLYYHREKSIEESRDRQANVSKKISQQLVANLRRKHPKIIKYRLMYRIVKIPLSILRFFFHWKVSEHGIIFRIFRIWFIPKSKYSKVPTILIRTRE
jgi:glycosyltransferase involved in cell wall biosynthesis